MLTQRLDFVGELQELELIPSLLLPSVHLFSITSKKLIEKELAFSRMLDLAFLQVMDQICTGMTVLAHQES